MTAAPALRLRLRFDAERAMGPGKADLLDAIAQAGSISAAGRRLRMSYKRAWQLIDDLNRSFAAPLVETSKGGERGGGAHLTPTGVAVLATWRRLEDKARTAAKDEIRALAALTRRKSASKDGAESKPSRGG